MRLLFAFLLLALVAGVIWAAASDTAFIEDGGMSLDGYTSAEFLAVGGSATIKLCNENAGTLVRTHYLKDGIARQFKWSRVYDGIDSVYVDITGASEVVVTPH